MIYEKCSDHKTDLKQLLLQWKSISEKRVINFTEVLLMKIQNFVREINFPKGGNRFLGLKTESWKTQKSQDTKWKLIPGDHRLDNTVKLSSGFRHKQCRRAIHDNINQTNNLCIIDQKDMCVVSGWTPIPASCLISELIFINYHFYITYFSRTNNSTFPYLNYINC